MIYLKHYWVRDGKYLTEIGKNGPLQSHPTGIDGFSVRYWLTDDRGVDYCLSTASDNALVEEHDPGMQILQKTEWDAIVATIPEPEPMPEMPGQPDWNTFKTTAVASTTLNTFVGELMSVAPVAATALPVTLMSLELGNFNDFMTVWGTIENVTTVPSALVTEMTTLAESCNLPQEFVSIFAA